MAFGSSCAFTSTHVLARIRWLGLIKGLSSSCARLWKGFMTLKRGAKSEHLAA